MNHDFYCLSIFSIFEFVEGVRFVEDLDTLGMYVGKPYLQFPIFNNDAVYEILKSPRTDGPYRRLMGAQLQAHMCQFEDFPEYFEGVDNETLGFRIF